MRRIRPYVICALATVLAVACGKRAAGPAADRYRADEAEVTKAPPASDAAAALTERAPDGRPDGTRQKIVHTGTLSITVQSYAGSRQAIDELIQKAGGVVGSAQVNHQDGDVSSATLVLRIPADRFDEVVTKLAQLGEVSEESIHADDVTAQWVDLDARLRNSRQMEARLLEIVQNRPSNVADLLEVERELGRVRGEIEQMEGEMRVMNDQVALGTLQLSVYTKAHPPVAIAPPSMGSRLGRSLSGSWHGLVSVSQAALVGFVAMIPWLPIPLGLAFVISRRRRARRAPAA